MSLLLEPFTLRQLTLPNRIAKAGIPIPMLMNVVGLTSIPDLNCDGDADALRIRNVRLSPRSSLPVDLRVSMG